MGEPPALARLAAASGWRAGRQLGRGQYGTAYLVEWSGEEPSTGSSSSTATVGGGIRGDAAADVLVGDRRRVEAEIGDKAVAKVVGLEALREHEQSLAFQEVEFMRDLRHPHIVSLIDHFVTEASLELVIVMEFCSGGDLKEEVKRRSQTKPPSHIPEVQIMRWFVQLTLALNYIHQRHILHRDLKSSNIFLTEIADDEYTLKIGDFGIARVLEGTVEVAATVVGTPYYMSPEVCKAEPYDYKSDIWALGCVLYELCMLKHAFQSQSLLGLVYKIVSETYAPIPQQYSADLRNLMERILDKSHFTRPTGRELLADPFVQKFVTPGTDGATIDQSLCDPGCKQSPRVQPHSRAQKLAPPPKASLQPTRGPSLQRAAHSGGGPPVAPDAALKVSGQAQTEEPTRRQWCAEPVASVPLDERDLRVHVFVRRIQLALARRRQNWLQVFASFDSAGNGQLQESEFEQAITSMALGLSDNEIREVRIHLQGTGICVPVDTFGTALHKAPDDVIQLESWGRRVLMDLTREAAMSDRGNNLMPGACVRVQGFESSVGARLNGSEGVIDKWDATACCWIVRLGDGARTPIRDEHLHVTKPPAQRPVVRVNSGTPDTTAIYRLLCGGGETAVPEFRFLDVVRRLLPSLSEAERYRLVLLLPKSPEGRIDVPEALSQFAMVGMTAQMKTTPEKPKKVVQVCPGPSVPGPQLPLEHVRGNVTWSTLADGFTPEDVPGTVPSPRTNMIVPPVASPLRPTNLGSNKTFVADNCCVVQPVHVEVMLLRLAQSLLGRTPARGPGLDLLRLFMTQSLDISLEALLDAVSVLPLGISRAEVRHVFSSLCKDSTPNDGETSATIPFAALASAIETAHGAGIPSEAAVVERLDTKRLGAALQRLGSAEAGDGRASPQEFRVKLMQAEPYLTPCQLEWLMMLTDKDGEGRLLPFSLLAHLGLAGSVALRGHTSLWNVAARRPQSSRFPIAANTPRSVVVASGLVRIRENLLSAGPQLRLDKVVELFGNDGKVKPTREALASLLGNLRLGVSVAEADEIICRTCIASGSPSRGVQLNKLYDALFHAGEAEMQSVVSELRNEAIGLCFGRGLAFAKAIGSADLGGWICEAQFRRCIASVLSDEAIRVDPDVLDRLVLVAEKSASGDVKWRQFAQSFAGLQEADSWSECSTSPSESNKRMLSPKRGHRTEKVEPSSTAQSWRSAKLQQAAVMRSGTTFEKIKAQDTLVEVQSEPPPARRLCRCFKRLLF